MFIVAIAVILLLTLDISCLTKKKQELVLPLSFCIIGIYGYLFACVGGLGISIPAFFILLAALNLYLIKTGNLCLSKDYIRSFFSPGIAAFLVLSLGLWIFLSGKITRGGDEYSCWATTVKHLFYYNELPLRGQSNVVYNAYIPGVGLVKYFFMKIQRTYTDNLLYRIHAMWTVACLIPIYAKETFESGKARYAEWAAKAVICVLFPMALCTECYSLIIVDCLLGCVFLYGVLLFFSLEHDAAFYFLETCVCVMLVLMKESGLIMAGTLVMMVLASDLFERGIKVWKKLWMPLLVLAVYLSWKVQCHLYQGNVGKTVGDFKVSFTSIGELLAGDAGARVREIAKNFVRAFFDLRDVEMYNAAFPISGVIWILLLIFFMLLMKNGTERHRCAGAASGIAVGTAAYYAMLLYTYAIIWVESPWVMALPSYRRYVTSWWFGIIGGLCMALLLQEGSARRKKRLLAGLLIFLALSGVRWLGLKRYGWWDNKTSIKFRDEYVGNVEQYLEKLDRDDRVYVIAQEDGGAHLMALYAFTPVLCNPEIEYGQETFSYSLGKSESDFKSTDYTPSEWADVLCDYTYVYICKKNEVFENTYGHMFEDEIKDGILYRIDRDSAGGISFAEVGLSE